MVLVAKPKQPTHSIQHKKRHGLHQKHNERFLKTYWPYLPMLMIGAVGLAVLGAVTIGPLGAVLGGASVTIAGALFIL